MKNTTDKKQKIQFGNFEFSESNFNKFVEVVEIVRAEQRNYFLNRTHENLSRCKNLEKRLDKIVINFKTKTLL